jgi:hypothetical protein
MKKPILFEGNYHETIINLFKNEFISLLRPRVLWVDCYVIPIIKLTRRLKEHPRINGQLYFLQPKSLESFESLLNSGELYDITNHGFSSLILSIPEYCIIQTETEFLIKKLSENLIIFLLMSEIQASKFKLSDVTIVQIDQEGNLD